MLNKFYEKHMSFALAGRLDESRLGNMRSTSIGGSSLSTALVFLLLQTRLETFSLQLSLVCAAVAIPAWIVTWQMVEAYIFYGKSSYGHFSTPKGSGAAILVFLVAALALFIGLAALLWHLMPLAAVVFSVLCIAMCIFVYWHQNAVQAWADKHGGLG